VQLLWRDVIGRSPRTVPRATSASVEECAFEPRDQPGKASAPGRRFPDLRVRLALFALD
jgi:hypothetical protein